PFAVRACSRRRLGLALAAREVLVGKGAHGRHEMNLKKSFSAVLAVLALGVSAPGCIHPDDTLGSLCASPAEGGEFCVRANEGPFAAWNQAKDHGSLPIQMWAKPPDAVTLDQLVASEDKLNAWFADIDTVLAFVRDHEKCAECYKASMSG